MTFGDPPRCPRDSRCVRGETYLVYARLRFSHRRTVPFRAARCATPPCLNITCGRVWVERYKGVVV